MYLLEPIFTERTGLPRDRFGFLFRPAWYNFHEDVIHDYILEHFKGDCLLVVGDDTLIKIHFHTNEPWLVLEYGQSIGDIYDVVVENMQRQEEGLQG